MFVFARATGHFPSKIIVPLRSFLIIYLQQITNYIYFLTVLLQNSKKKNKNKQTKKKQNRTRKKARKLKRLIHPFHIKISTDQCIDQLYDAHFYSSSCEIKLFSHNHEFSKFPIPKYCNIPYFSCNFTITRFFPLFSSLYACKSVLNFVYNVVKYHVTKSSYSRYNQSSISLHCVTIYNINH